MKPSQTEAYDEGALISNGTNKNNRRKILRIKKGQRLSQPFK
jgi:hypothetical protein